MLIWVIFALMACAVVLALARPLRAPIEAGNTPSEAAVEVYRDQLAEIDAEERRGAVSTQDAAAARIEVARRLIGAADTRAATKPSGASFNAKFALIAAAAVPLLAVLLYLPVGAPGLPGRPFAERMAGAPDVADVYALIARVEARLKSHPEDGTGWDVIAPIYIGQQRYQDAVRAYARSMQLLGETPQRLAGFAEASVLAHDGRVTPEAAAAYVKLAKQFPDRIEPRYWLALAKEQAGKLAEAEADYAAMLAGAPAEAPWRGMVQERLDTVRQGQASGSQPTPQSAPPASGVASGPARAAPGPSREDVAAAATMSEAERNAMIRGMVDGLAERLATDGRDGAGWQRLVRAYIVLGEKEKAQAALGRARKALAGDEVQTQALEQFARALGLQGLGG